MRAVHRLPSSHRAPFLGPHTSQVTAAENDAVDVFEVHKDDDMTGKEEAVRGFDPAELHTRQSLAHQLPGRRRQKSSLRRFSDL